MGFPQGRRCATRDVDRDQFVRRKAEAEFHYATLISSLEMRRSPQAQWRRQGAQGSPRACALFFWGGVDAEINPEAARAGRRRFWSSRAR